MSQGRRMPSWKISVLSQALEPGSRPPTSPWCAVVHVKPISSPARWTGLKTKMSCRCMPPSKGSFITNTSPGRIRSRVVLEQRLHRVRDRAEVERHADRLRDRPALGVADDGREVHPVADDGRVRGAADRRRHLVGHRRERVADDLERDRVDARLSRHRASFQDQRAGCRVAPRRPAGRDDDGRVVLVHEQRARLGRLADGERASAPARRCRRSGEWRRSSPRRSLRAGRSASPPPHRAPRGAAPGSRPASPPGP